MTSTAQSAPTDRARSGDDLFDPASYQMGRSIGYLLARAKSRLACAVEQQIADLDITHAQAGCLMMLAQGTAHTVTDLGRELGTDAGSITRLLSRMERRGLIARTRRDDDRRVVDLSITPAGAALASRLPAVYCDVLRSHFKGFSAEEIDTLRGMLQRVIENHHDLYRQDRS
ncbi:MULTISPECIES: MarR family winged helix-turn-helix transcriptional regulator [unclassified Cupriavidus]|uniref:MarR family winged helix-turn-helix transcriptional regulator n=1 Tax=Cupriavidus sp. H19C3 TaxID=3241603 RepID=UPI003BF7813C